MTETETTFRAWRAVLRALLAAALITIALPIGLALAGEKAAYAIGVDGLACPFCAYGIEKGLGRIEGVEDVTTDIASGTVTVTMAEGATLKEDAARKAVEAAGFELRSFEEIPAGQEAAQ